MRFRTLFTTVIIPLLSITLFYGSGMLGNAGTNHLPTVAELETISFAPVTSAPSENPPYAEVSAAKGLFIAYRGGSDAISKYREPVLTRGTRGIAVFKTVSPAVVVVVVGSMKDGDFDLEGIGTGAIVDSRGYVLTNWHVIKDHPGAVVFLKPTNSSELVTAEGRVARVVYQDTAIDLALLHLIKPPSTLHSIPVGDIAQVEIAEDIHIIGHPHGNLWSYTTGVVSQIRDGYTWTYTDGSQHSAKVLQLQTAINPGNFGGPVVDDRGNILGLVAMSEEGQNLDWAIAADVIKRFLFLGLQMTTRGIEASMPSPIRPEQVLSGKLGDSRLVLKAVYADAVLHTIPGAGNDSALVAKFRDDTEVEAWNPDQNGEFRSWSVRLRNGNELVGTASNGALTSISMRQG